MAERLYHFFINPFLIVTRRSNKLMLSIGEDHEAKLTAFQADADVGAMKLAYDPIWQSYKTADQNYKSAKGTYKGKTQTVEESFEKLNHEKLNQWRGTIHGVYNEGTAEETSFFPQKRKPFQTGTYEDRIQAIKVLGEKCAADADATVAALGAVILAFYTSIAGARLLQQSQGEAAVKGLRELRETSRVLLSQRLFGDLCLLLNKHRSNPTDVAKYFEMSYLRSSGSDWTEVEVDANDVVNINDSVEPGEVVGAKAKNTSHEDVTMGIYFANSLSERPQPGYAVVELHQGSQIILNETLLGPPKPFLNVINLSTQHIGSMEITDDLVSGQPLAN